MRNTLATIALAGVLMSCNTVSERVVIQYRDCVQPQVTYETQGNNIRVPRVDWDLGDTRYLVLNTSEFRTPGMRTVGNIPGHDGRMYDLRMDLVDSNGDRQYDLVRVTLNSTVIEHPDERLSTGRMLGRTMIQDRDFDGIVDAVWTDHLGPSGERWMDGMYDVMLENDDIRDETMQNLIDHWLIFLPQGELGMRPPDTDLRLAYR